MSRILDSFANLLSGLGLGNPKTAANTYMGAALINGGGNPVELDNAYRGSTWFGRIVDDRPGDATSEWRSWQADGSTVTALEAEEKRLDVLRAVRRALVYNRLYGGSAIYLGGLPGQPSEPLDVNRVGKGALKYLIVWNRHELTAGQIVRDPTDPGYGRPSYFEINGVRIHPSRLITFVGRRGSDSTMTDFWGDSIWVHMRDSVSNADATAAVLAALMQEAKSDVVKVSNLLGNMATDEYTDLMARRFQMAQMLKSVTGVTLLDKDDEWSTRQITWNGLSQVVESQLIIMCGAAGYPVTRLIGTSARGLNATGEGDLRNYYDSVRREQQTEISPNIATLDECIIRSALGSRPPEVWYYWSPLWTPSEKERAETGKIQAETDKLYAESGLIPEPALAASVTARLVDGNAYPGLSENVAQFAEVPVDEPDDDSALAADAAPRTLYVSRAVLNPSDILEWAKGQGLVDLEGRTELHVTVLYSRTAVDWLAMGNAHSWGGESNDGNLTIAPGGPRVIERLGPKRVVALSFSSTDLQWRHRSMVDRGAHHAFDDYTPHITLSKNSHELIDLNMLEPYRGRIVLGPERFEAIED